MTKRRACQTLVSLLIGCVVIWTNSCDGSKEKSETSNVFQNFEQAKPVMKEVLYELQINPEWVNAQNINLLKERSITFDEAFGKDVLRKASNKLVSSQTIQVDEYVYDMKIELFNDDHADDFAKRLSKSDGDFIYGLILDPDQFYSNETDEEITVPILKSDNTTEEIKLKNPDYYDDTWEYTLCNINLNSKNNLSYPVFSLTLSEVKSDDNLTKRVAKVSSTLYPWLEIHTINVYVTHDSGDEEFQLFGGAQEILQRQVVDTFGKTPTSNLMGPHKKILREAGGQYI